MIPLNLHLQYPQEILLNLVKIFNYRYSYQYDNIYEMFDYIFNRISIKSNRWIEIPDDTKRSILGQHAAKIITKLSDYISVDNSYDAGNVSGRSQCKKYTISNNFLKIMNEFNCPTQTTTFLIAEIKAAQIQKQQSIINNQSINNNSSIMSMSEKSEYSIDLLAINEITDILYDSVNGGRIDQKQAVIQRTKKALKTILLGDLRNTISKKNGRHYNSITQIKKDIRKLIMKKTDKYIGQLDLKCCHGFIVLNLLKSNLSNEEYINLFELFKNPALWQDLMNLTGITSKDKIKSKFQLFMNGSFNDNRGNILYNWFSKNHGNFTNLLNQYKLNKNLSNEINMIEASIMHSDALNQYIEVLELNCDVVHDCLWLYGKGDINTTIGKAAQYILYLFKSVHNMDMVFTLEVEGKEKEIIQ